MLSFIVKTLRFSPCPPCLRGNIFPIPPVFNQPVPRINYKNPRNIIPCLVKFNPIYRIINSIPRINRRTFIFTKYIPIILNNNFVFIKHIPYF